MIPGRTGRAVFAGHWAQTIDPQGKDEFIRFLFGPPSPALPARALPVLRRNQVRWIALDTASRSLYGLPDDDGAIGASQIGAVRFHNGWVTIWSVDGDGQLPPRWRTGNWPGGATATARPPSGPAPPPGGAGPRAPAGVFY